MVRTWLRGRRVPGSKPDSIEDPLSMGSLTWKSYAVVKRPPVGATRKIIEGAPAQASSSSSDCGSKSLGPSQNSPRVASKRGVKIIKLNCIDISIQDYSSSQRRGYFAVHRH
ncbi:hypothetical protein AVEN_272130-1 [Araneus ventricosus]|uniref:Uncharacterized protein n=1 Tax=Araneus ventricosus TaxID=182803 RepID=A0A4Y2P7N6_ARAVE|nr:hypothetical protein AVEN_272130-1 [Araneus ventricosus]